MVLNYSSPPAGSPGSNTPISPASFSHVRVNYGNVPKLRLSSSYHQCFQRQSLDLDDGHEDLDEDEDEEVTEEMEQENKVLFMLPHLTEAIRLLPAQAMALLGVSTQRHVLLNPPPAPPSSRSSTAVPGFQTLPLSVSSPEALSHRARSPRVVASPFPPEAADEEEVVVGSG